MPEDKNNSMKNCDHHYAADYYTPLSSTPAMFYCHKRMKGVLKLPEFDLSRTWKKFLLKKLGLDEKLKNMYLE